MWCSLGIIDLIPQLDENGKSFELKSEALEEKIIELKNKGDNVKGFILVNPNNPLGEIYPPDLVLRLATVCAK